MSSGNEVLIFLLTLLTFIGVCVALYYFWRQVLAVVIVLGLLITLAVGAFFAYLHCSDHDCSGLRLIGLLIVVLALIGVVQKASDPWRRKRWIEKQVREGARRFREANPGNSSWRLLVEGFEYTWDEQANKVRRQEISEEVRERIEHMQQSGKTVSRHWIDQDGNTVIDYGDVDKDGNTHFT